MRLQVLTCAATGQSRCARDSLELLPSASRIMQSKEQMQVHGRKDVLVCWQVEPECECSFALNSMQFQERIDPFGIDALQSVRRSLPATLSGSIFIFTFHTG